MRLVTGLVSPVPSGIGGEQIAAASAAAPVWGFVGESMPLYSLPASAGAWHVRNGDGMRMETDLPAPYG